MDQPSVSAREPAVLRAAGALLVERAARDLEGFAEEMVLPGHWPSWGSPHVPDGLALCVGCWRLITAWQLGREGCPGSESRATVASHAARTVTRQGEGNGQGSPSAEGSL